MAKFLRLTFAGLGHKVNAGILDTPDRYPEPGTSDQRHWDIGVALDRQLAHIQSGGVGDGHLQADNSDLGAG